METRTRCAQGHPRPEGSGHPHAPSIVPASTFTFDSQAAIDAYYRTGEGFVYSRYGNPTEQDAAALLAALEGAERTLLFSSGMAAIHTSLVASLPARGRLMAQRELYGGSGSLIRDLLVESGYRVDWRSREQIGRLQREDLVGCDVLYLETPINPTLRLVDLRHACRVAREAGTRVLVDSTFATPIFQRALELGADLVLHSATKYLGGHSDLLGGAVSGRREAIEPIEKRRRLLGGVMDPFTAFLLHRGMRTLAVRMEAHARGALAVARWLAADPRVESVHHPGLPDHPDRPILEQQMNGTGGMLSFSPLGGAAAAVRCHDRLRLFARAGSLGGVGSLVSIPARMSHRYLDAEARREIGVPDHLVRLSVGLESESDLIEDLDRALGKEGSS